MAISRFSTSSVAQGLPKYQKLWDGTSAVFDSDYELIERVTATSGTASSFTFSSIPSTYTHLQIRGVARGLGSNNASLGIRVNGDSSSNQSPFGQTYGDGSTVSAAGGAASDGYTASLTGPIAAGTSASNFFTGVIIDILEYKNTNKLKTIRSFAGVDFNSSGFISLRSTMNINVLSSAITSLTLVTYNTGGTDGFAQYSSFGLYGIKGAA